MKPCPCDPLLDLFLEVGGIRIEEHPLGERKLVKPQEGAVGLRKIEAESGSFVE